MASSVSSSQSLAQYRETIATLSGGKEANEEAWMTMWCSSNWAELLQPAPLSIALLGSVLCIASGTDDFSAYPHACRAFWEVVVGGFMEVLIIWALRSSHSTAGRRAQVSVEVCQAPRLIQNVPHAGDPAPPILRVCDLTILKLADGR